jgi:hypothetical protein
MGMKGGVLGERSRPGRGCGTIDGMEWKVVTLNVNYMLICSNT